MIRITRIVKPSVELTDYAASFSPFRTLLETYLPASIQNLYARPVIADDGAVEWYSDINGQPRRLLDLSETEQSRARTVLEQRLDSVRALHQKLAQSGSEPETMLRLLQAATHSPVPEQVWVIDGHPVIVPPAEGAPRAAAAATAAVSSRRWWPWLLLLALLIALILLLLSRCSPLHETAAPVTPAPPAVTPEEPVKPETTPAPHAPVKPTKAVCPAQRTQQQAPEMVVIMDASGSMAITMDATQDELISWNQGKYVENIEREPRRISLARNAAKGIIDTIPRDMNISLVAAENCRQVSLSPSFPFAQRSALKKRIEGIQPVGKTPLAEALALAGKKVDGVNRDAIILLVSDGDETCGGDPCQVARELKKSKPRLQVNVVDIMSTGAGNCIASSTGGKVFAVNNTREFKQIMKKAMQEYIPEGCE
ncbi:VWA domain-containing protein [Kosakonia cowanii]|uniref:VWA domain-containing protein n=1 Tax=Kosakonia cowanii TaxID=208223 RepID=UPI003F69BB54